MQLKFALKLPITEDTSLQQLKHVLFKVRDPVGIALRSKDGRPNVRKSAPCASSYKLSLFVSAHLVRSSSSWDSRAYCIYAFSTRHVIISTMLSMLRLVCLSLFLRLMTVSRMLSISIIHISFCFRTPFRTSSISPSNALLNAWTSSISAFQTGLVSFILLMQSRISYISAIIYRYNALDTYCSSSSSFSLDSSAISGVISCFTGDLATLTSLAIRTCFYFFVGEGDCSTGSRISAGVGIVVNAFFFARSFKIDFFLTSTSFISFMMF